MPLPMQDTNTFDNGGESAITGDGRPGKREAVLVMKSADHIDCRQAYSLKSWD
jgi:hypothetical protein